MVRVPVRRWKCCNNCKLQVPMIVDDPITLDAHAGQTYDGQGVAGTSQTGSPRVKVGQLCLGIAQPSNVSAELRKMGGHNRNRVQACPGSNDPTARGSTSQNVQYCLKAPSTMLKSWP